MCARYQVKLKLKDLERDFGIKVPGAIETIETDVYPAAMAPVVVRAHEGLALDFMRYGLVPYWSKDAKPKFPTYNARIETVLEKPSWRNSFQKRHVIAPLSGFLESVREGKLAGNMVEFLREDQGPLYAAGIYDVWKDPLTKDETHSFAILTREPSAFILENGHDRSPIFLSEDAAHEWLELDLPPGEFKNWLLDATAAPKLQVRVNRPLASGKRKLPPALPSEPVQPALIPEP